MRTVSENTSQNPPIARGATFSATLSDGREIVIREMKGSDLIYMEEELAKFGETKKSFYLIERLNVGSTKITFDEIADLGIRDIKTISELVARANGAEDDTEELDPK